MWSSVWPVVTFAVGGASTYFRDGLAEKRRLAREKGARDAERKRAVIDRRETFELDHLQKLNDALAGLGRAAGEAHHIDTMASRQTGVYAGTQIGEEASNAMMLANRNVSTLAGLVLDDALRTAVEHAHEQLNIPSSMHRSRVEDAQAAFHRAFLALDRAQALIAERIREIYLTMDAG